MHIHPVPVQTRIPRSQPSFLSLSSGHALEDVHIPVKLDRSSRLPVVDVAERHDPWQLGIFAPLFLRRPPIYPRLHLVPRVGRVHVHGRDDARVVKRQAEACQPGPTSKGSSISSSSFRIWRWWRMLTRRSSSARNMARRRPWSTVSNRAADLRVASVNYHSLTMRAQSRLTKTRGREFTLLLDLQDLCDGRQLVLRLRSISPSCERAQ